MVPVLLAIVGLNTLALGCLNEGALGIDSLALGGGEGSVGLGCEGSAGLEGVGREGAGGAIGTGGALSPELVSLCPGYGLGIFFIFAFSNALLGSGLVILRFSISCSAKVICLLILPMTMLTRVLSPLVNAGLASIVLYNCWNRALTMIAVFISWREPIMLSRNFMSLLLGSMSCFPFTSPVCMIACIIMGEWFPGQWDGQRFLAAA